MTAASRHTAPADRRRWLKNLLEATDARDLGLLRKQVEDEVTLKDFGD
jgi:hypothetical protein